MIRITFCIVQHKPVSLFGKSVIRVITGSMEPAIHVDECVWIQKKNTDDLATGDIIAFVSEDVQIKGQIVLHRIKKICSDGSYIVQGDANPVEDALAVAPSQIVGVYVRKSTFFTWLISFGDYRKPLFFVIMCITGAMLLHEIRNIIQIRYELQKEEKKAEQSELFRDAIEKEKQRLREEEERKKESEDT